MHKLVLLPLNYIRVWHFTLEQADVELGDQLTRSAVTEMKQRRRYTARRRLREHLCLEPKSDQHFDRRRVDRGGALIFGSVRQLFDQRHRNALLDERKCNDRPDWPAPGNDHAVCVLHHRLVHTQEVTTSQLPSGSQKVFNSTVVVTET